MDMPQATPAQAPVPEQKAPSKILTQYYGATVLFLMAIFLVVSFGFLKPMIEEIKQANAETESTLQTAQNERTYLGSLDASIGAAQSIPAITLKQVTEALPDAVDTPSLLVQFDAAAARNAVKVQAVNLSEQKTAPNAATQAKPGTGQVTPVDITLTLSAKNYFDVKRFLADVETSLRIMDVVGISTGGATVDGQEFAFTVQVRAYTFSHATR